MHAALEAVESLGSYSSQHETPKTDTDPQSQLTQAIGDWDADASNHKDAGGQGGQCTVGAYVPAGMTLATPETLVSYIGEHISTISRLNQQYTAGQRCVVNGGAGISLSAHSGDWKTIAHRGQLVLQA